MAKRQACLAFDDIRDFLEQWDSQLSKGSAFLPADQVSAELAASFKLDLDLPLVGRVGPIEAQVIHRSPDGGVAVQFSSLPPEVKTKVDGLLSMAAQIREQVLESAPSAPAPASASVAAPIQAPAETAGAHPGGGLVLPDLGDNKADFSGDMGGRTLRDLMVQLAVERATGLLTVVSADGTRKFGLWSKGGPVGWRSEPIVTDEVLGVLLFKSGHVSKEQLAESLEVMKKQRCRQGEAFIEMGLLTFAQLVMVLQKQVEFVMQQIMADRKGVWAFHRLERLPEQYINPPLRVPSMLFSALRDHAKELPPESLHQVLRDNLDRYVAIDPKAEPVISDIRWTKDEKKFLEVMRENSWRVRELFSVSNLSRNMTACVIWSLNDLGFLVYKDEEDLERYLERVASRILNKARRLNKANHFDVLEIHWICRSEDIEEAYERLCKEFDPAGYHDLPEDVIRAINRVRTRLDEASGAILDDRQRRAYREEVIEKDTIVQSAELLAKKGEMAIMKNDKREAHLCWGKALELMPGNTKYREGYQRSLTTG